jgi:hypothetical protein
MSPHSNTSSWFRVNHSLLSLLNDVCSFASNFHTMVTTMCPMNRQPLYINHRVFKTITVRVYVIFHFCDSMWSLWVEANLVVYIYFVYGDPIIKNECILVFSAIFSNISWVCTHLCKLQKGCTRLAAASDKFYQLLVQGRRFSPGTPPIKRILCVYWFEVRGDRSLCWYWRNC